ncbi:MAG: M20 family metallopeptidase [Lachnospiraceae bacterium]|jgi:amidohydrolase
MREKVNGWIDENRDKIVEVATWLYEHPEIALEEVESSKYLADWLEREGFQVERAFAGVPTAFKAVKKQGEGPRIAYLAEYDALPGCGHACGHHMIAAMSVGAAAALSQILDEVGGEIAVFGTPAEETGDGKSYLTDQGVFKGYDAAMIIHPGGATELYPKMNAVSGMDFVFTGRASHAGALPYEGINALDAVVLLYNNINALRQQLRDGTRIHGIILEAGEAANVIPDKGKVRLEFRTDDQDYFDEITQKVVNCAKAAALATGCELEYDWFEPISKVLRHNHTLGAVMEKYMKEYGVYGTLDVGGGSTDVGNVSQEIPTIHPMLKVTEEPLGPHTQEFKEATMTPYALEHMIIGVRILALTGMEILKDSELRHRIKAEFET